MTAPFLPTQPLQPAAEFIYGARVQKLFANLQHAGAPPEGALCAEAGSREQAASVQCWFVLADGMVQQAGYQAYGCPHFLAACESMTQWLEGKTLAECSRWPWRELAIELALPASKRNKLLILQDALQALIT